MSVADDELLKRSGFKDGLNNLSAETALAPTSLREAMNIDLDRSGKPHRRVGREQVVAAVSLTHSLWSDDYLSFGLFADGADLKVLHGDDTTETVHTGLGRGLPVSYDRFNDAVAFTNGAQCGMVTQDLDVLPWACPSPNGQPTLAATTGALDPGIYQVAVTFVDSLGRESGTSRASMIELPTGGGIALSAIPQPVDASVVKVRVYCTNGNTAELRRAVALQAGTGSYTIAQRVEGKKTLKTQFLSPLPAGQIVRYGHGRQFVAWNRELLYSPVMRYGLFDPRGARVGYAGRVDLVNPVGDGDAGAGVYVADAKKTYWHAGGNPAKWSQKIAYPVGAVPGTLAITPGDVWGFQTSDPIAVWLAKNGVWVAGLPGGVLVPMKNDAAVDMAERGASFYQEIAGRRQFVTSLQGAQPQGFAVRDKMIVREYRREQPAQQP